MNKPKFDGVFWYSHGYMPQPEAYKNSNSEISKKVFEKQGAARATLEQLEKFENEQAKDLSRPIQSRKQLVANFARQQSAELSNELLQLQTDYTKQIGRYLAKLEAAYQPDSPALEQRRASIRRDLATLDRVERDKRIRAALNNNEQDVIAAIATSPQNDKTCTTYQYSEARKAFDENTLGHEAATYHDLTVGLYVLEEVTHNLDADVNRHFIRPAIVKQENEDAAMKEYFAKQ
ncbi:hypothetical protein [Hyphococcus sp.]|uniref:hypothetical protein n=1 Tax=Hyphococcus sp. TaxID=2038636 RepID=UPI003CCB9203